LDKGSGKKGKPRRSDKQTKKNGVNGIKKTTSGTHKETERNADKFMVIVWEKNQTK